MTGEATLANLFELTGDDVDVTYSSSGITGQPQLSYRTPDTNLNFMGRDIQTAETALGSEHTVTLEQVSDLKVVTFTLILPPVHVNQLSAGTCISVPGVVTTSHTTIAGPALGPEKTYRLVRLHGTAQAVAF